MIAVLRLRVRIVAALFIAAALAASAAAVDAPAWMLDVSRRPAPEVSTEATAVALLDEATVTVAPDGRRTLQRRVVKRILKREGMRHAVAYQSYQQTGDRVKSLNAWLLPTDGKVRVYGKKEVLDISLEHTLLYTESRVATIDASGVAGPGSVFAWESVVEEPPFLSEYLWAFPTDHPTALARLIVKTPDGVRAEGFWLNHPGVEPVRTATSCTWELRDLPEIKSEPHDPPASRLTPAVRFDLTWTKPAARPSTVQQCATWGEVVTFARRYAVPEPAGPSIAAKANELCAGKSTAWEQITTLAKYVQQLRYVAIAANLRSGGGFRPNRPDAVLGHGYGDCKDKSCLLGALLAARGLTSYPVLCYSGDRAAVRTAWPTPIQFNHMLIAIAVDDSVSSPFVITDAKLGRVLLFDPTDPFVSLGDFPQINQGGLVLVCKPGNDQLTSVPFSPASVNLLHRRISATLHANGTALLRLNDSATGYAAARERERFFDRAAVKKLTEERLRELRANSTVHVAEAAEGANDSFTTRFEFTVPNYVKPIGVDAFAFRPLLVGGVPLPAFTEKTRRHPIVLSPLRSQLDAEFELPRGFRVVDTAAPQKVERSFGRYSASTEIKDGRVLFHRQIEVDAVELPAERYEELRAFLEAIRKIENTQIVFERS